jgi:hypothetical protein
MEPNCDKCKKKCVCMFVEKSKNFHVPGLDRFWEFRDEVIKFTYSILPKYCKSFEAFPNVEYPGRDHLGRLINRKPLKLWYPLAKQPCEMREQKECDCWWCQTYGGYQDSILGCPWGEIKSIKNEKPYSSLHVPQLLKDLCIEDYRYSEYEEAIKQLCDQMGIDLNSEELEERRG